MTRAVDLGRKATKQTNKLSKYIEGSEATMLANDSSDIVKVIKENYEVGYI